MKLNSVLLCALVLTIPLLTSCEASSAAETETSADVTKTSHVHSYGAWDRNAQDHWQICECGETVSEKETHSLNEEDLCAVCGSVVCLYDDGGAYVYNPNEDGYIFRRTSYDSDGKIFNEEKSEFALDADGIPYESYNYSINYEFGYMYESTYNALGDILTRVMTDLNDGTVDNDRWERDYNEDGHIMWEKQYRNDFLIFETCDYKETQTDTYYVRYPETMIDYYGDGTKLVTVFGEFGMEISETEYTADGSVVTQTIYNRQFDDDGNTLYFEANTDGKLVSVEEYAYDEFGYTYISTQTEYNDDGTTTVTTYDAEGNTAYVIYAADGSIIEES